MLYFILKYSFGYFAMLILTLEDVVVMPFKILLGR